MNNKIRFSNEHLVLADIMQHHTDLKNALRLYFSEDNKNLQARFSEYTNKKLLFQELSKRTDELDLSSVFSLFSAIEAAFRIDCLQRISKKKNDPLSRLFDKKYSKKKQDKIGIIIFCLYIRKILLVNFYCLQKNKAAKHFSNLCGVA